ncbi:MAG: hypothetical protein J6V80_02730 [Clostridia bacterium]|nr:hypothetical protein [Clostridia bacterium]
MSKNSTVNSTRRAHLAFTSALLAIIILAMTLLGASCQKKENFDYLKNDLSEYVELAENYKNLKIEIDIAKPHDIDVEVAIINMLYADKEDEALYGGGYVSYPNISVGDVVDIWYRGYLLDDEGKEIVVAGMSNFGSDKPHSLAIGSNGFIPGFELNLIGKDTKNAPKFSKITEGKVTESQIAYVTYTKVKGGDESSKITESNVRIDLSGDVDAKFGSGVKETMLALKIGDKVDINADLNGTSYSYRDFTVNFVTECEKNPIVVECYFPYDYQQTDLRNETAYFEVYVVGALEYNCPVFDDAYLTNKINEKKINVTLDELNKYEGATLVDKYRAFAEKKMMDLYEETYTEMVEEETWNQIISLAKIKKYPTEMVEEVYEDYIDEIKYEFKRTGGQLPNNYTGQYTTYQTLDDFARAYVGVTGSVKWQDQVYKEAENFIKERLVMFYILRTENLLPTGEVYETELEKVKKEYLDEAIAQYMYYDGNKTRDDYNDEEYAELLKECQNIVSSNFDEDYFNIRANYEVLCKTIVTWPEVSTLDNRRAYPLDK